MVSPSTVSGSIPSISVCVAAFNGEKYIRQQLDSIIQQIQSDDEIVVVDDGSSDSTASIVAAIDDCRVRLVQQKNGGVVRAFEAAMRHAEKDLIMLCDQDDVWLDGRIKMARAAFSDVVCDKLVLLNGFVWNSDDTSGALSTTVFDFVGYRRGVFRNIWRNSYQGNTFVFPRSMSGAFLPFPASIPMHDSWIGILSEIFYRVEVDDRASFKYRIHGANLSQRSRPIGKKLADRLRLVYFLSVRFCKLILFAGR